MKRWILIFITMGGWTLWSIFNKLALQRLHPLQMQLVGCVVGLTLTPLYCYILFSKALTLPVNITGIIFTGLACLCAIIAGFAYLLGIREGELGTISVLSSSYPLLVFALSALFFQESITTTKIIGMVLIVGGVVILGR